MGEAIQLQQYLVTRLKQSSDDELTAMWTRLEKGLVASGSDDATSIECAASLVAQEMLCRDMAIEGEELLGLAKSRGRLSDRLALLPDQIPLSGGDVYLVVHEDGDLLLVGGDKALGCSAAVAKSLHDVGIPATLAIAQAGDSDSSVQLYQLALVRADAGKTGPIAPQHQESERRLNDGSRATFIACSSDEKQIIYYLVSEPGTVDAHGHRITADVIEDALHGYMANSRELKIEHGKDGPLRHLAPQRGARITGRAIVVEGYVAPMELASFHGRKPPDGPIKAGSSIVGVHYTDPKLWQALKAEEHGISWGGFARKIDK